MGRRELRQEGERRSWWIEVDGDKLRIGFASDDDGDWTVRERRLPSAKEAEAEAGALIESQLADGFVEVGEAAEPPDRGPTAPSETAARYFERMAATWRLADADIDPGPWLDATRALSPSYTGDLHEKLERLASEPDWNEQSRVEEWLRACLPSAFEPLCLALRDPRYNVWARVVAALDALPQRLVPALEPILLSLIASPPPPPYPGGEVTPAHFRTVAMLNFSEPALARILALAASPDPSIATNAVFLLCRRSLTHPIIAALTSWNARTDVTGLTLSGIIWEDAVYRMSTILKRPRPASTAAALAPLLAAMAKRQLP